MSSQQILDRRQDALAAITIAEADLTRIQSILEAAEADAFAGRPGAEDRVAHLEVELAEAERRQRGASATVRHLDRELSAAVRAAAAARLAELRVAHQAQAARRQRAVDALHEALAGAWAALVMMGEVARDEQAAADALLVCARQAGLTTDSDATLLVIDGERLPRGEAPLGARPLWPSVVWDHLKHATLPQAAAGFCDALERYGRFPATYGALCRHALARLRATLDTTLEKQR